MVAELSKAGLYDFVWRLRERLDIRAPIDAVRLICEHCRNPAVRYLKWESPRIGGMLYARENSTTVALNACHSPEQRNFYALHEFIHYVMHSPGDRTTFCTDTFRDSVLEWQANEAAAELLVPMRGLLREYRAVWEHSLQNRGAGLNMDLYIQSAANLYKVTPGVIRNRFDLLAYEIEQHVGGVPLEEIAILSNRQKAAAGIKPMDPVERMDKQYYNYWRYREGREARLVREQMLCALGDPHSRFSRYDWLKP